MLTVSDECVYEVEVEVHAEVDVETEIQVGVATEKSKALPRRRHHNAARKCFRACVEGLDRYFPAQVRSSVAAAFRSTR